MLPALLQSLASIGLSTAVRLASLVIVAVSTLLQYVSHRTNVVDSRYERERKITDHLDDRQFTLESFTADGYAVTLDPIDVGVRERSGPAYEMAKVILPTAGIKGTTVLRMRLSSDSDIPEGLYIIEGFDPGTRGLRGLLARVSDDDDDMLAVEFDTVDPYLVAPAVIDVLSYSPTLRLVACGDDEERLDRFSALTRVFFTPDSHVYRRKADDSPTAG